jgi:hypothetical protein
VNKGKQKRLKKELDRLLSSGRYWEMLEVLRDEDLGKFYTKESREAWQAIVWRALRQPSSLEEFLSKSGERGAPPEDIPDIKFLFLLKDFVYADSLPDELGTIKGLSFPAEEIRKRVMNWEPGSFPEKKIKKLLDTFVAKPDKITGKHFDDMASLTKTTGLANPVHALGGMIGDIRKLNSQRAAHPVSGRLRTVDAALKNFSSQIPVHTRNVLLYPFVHHACRYFRLLIEKGQTAEFAEAVSSMPFLFTLIAGDKAAEIKERLTGFAPGMIDPAGLSRRIEDADFEEKLRLVGRIRQLIKEDSSEKEYAGYVRKLYDGILDGITEQRGTLSERERRELPAIVGPVITKDLHLLWRSPSELKDLLLKIMESGCLDTRLSLLSVIVSEHLGVKKLGESAVDALKRLRPPADADYAWLDNGFSFIFLPRVSLLRPLIDLFGRQEAFQRIFGNLMRKEAESALIANSIGGEKVFSFLDDLLPSRREIKGAFRTLRRELDTLKDYEPFAAAIRYLDCFPEGQYSEEGMRRVFQRNYEEGGIDALIELLENITGKISGNGYDASDFFFEDPLTNFYIKQERICVKLLKEHWDDLKIAGIKSIKRVFPLITDKLTAGSGRDGSLLIRMYNTLEYLLEQGEQEARPMRDAVWGMMHHHAQRGRKKR